MEHKFKPGDRVKITVGPGIIYYGEITIISEMRYKIIPDSGADWDYWYHPEEALELIDKKENES
jgi:hypothetical protein